MQIRKERRGYRRSRPRHLLRVCRAVSISLLWAASSLAQLPPGPNSPHVKKGGGRQTGQAAAQPSAPPNTEATTSPAVSPIPMRFRDIAAQAGLTKVPRTTTERRYLVETMGGGGIALFDCDDDGKLDVAVVNDSTIERYLAGGELMVTLYHQDPNSGAIHFKDVTESAGLATRGWGMGIAVGDYDNDGLPDLYVTGYGHNVLYHNLGGCRFEDVTDRAGLKVGGFSTGAAWADYDRDGHLDLFVTRYVRTDLRHLPPPNPRVAGYRSIILEMPDEMEGETDFLFRNRGDGTFEDVSQKAGVSDPNKLHGMGVVWGDYDGDGWPDLYVTNDSGFNFLYHNRRDGIFEEVGIISGNRRRPVRRDFREHGGGFRRFRPGWQARPFCDSVRQPTRESLLERRA